MSIPPTCVQCGTTTPPTRTYHSAGVETPAMYTLRISDGLPDAWIASTCVCGFQRTEPCPTAPSR